MSIAYTLSFALVFVLIARYRSTRLDLLARSQDLAGPTRLGPYRLAERLAKGSGATVYKALPRSRQPDPVALKVFHAETAARHDFRVRFYREMLNCYELVHPNIARCLAGGEEDGQFYLASELVEGTPLATRCHGAQMPADLFLGLAHQLLDAVSYAHRQGVMHRDLSPHNILVTKDRQVKLIDFGLAIAEADVSVTRTGVSLGSPAYMAPEMLLQGSKACDYRADQYSLGVIFYEMLSGQLPQSVASERSPDSLVPLANHRPDLDAALERFIMKMLAFEPSGRFPNLDSAKALLEEFS